MAKDAGLTQPAHRLKDGSSAKAIWISIGMVVRLAVSDGIKLKLNQGPRTEGFDTAFLVLVAHFKDQVICGYPFRFMFHVT